MRRMCLACLLVLVGLWPARSAGNDKEGAAVWPQDKGPTKVDVSGYPADAQQGYQILLNKCGECHSVSRPLNISMASDYWAHYVGNMKMRHGVGMTLDESRKLVKFLIADQEIRKNPRPKDFFPPFPLKSAQNNEGSPK